jgi:hypothetical protein
MPRIVTRGPPRRPFGVRLNVPRIWHLALRQCRSLARPPALSASGRCKRRKAKPSHQPATSTSSVRASQRPNPAAPTSAHQRPTVSPSTKPATDAPTGEDARMMASDRRAGSFVATAYGRREEGNERARRGVDHTGDRMDRSALVVRTAFALVVVSLAAACRDDGTERRALGALRRPRQRRRRSRRAVRHPVSRRNSPPLRADARARRRAWSRSVTTETSPAGRRSGRASTPRSIVPASGTGSSATHPGRITAGR